ncbi:MAG: hypothetical protein K2P88_03535 [Chitinophagaceae bacterium]|nr:hypothetical protein [Chitinophagaceae bacterium]
MVHSTNEYYIKTIDKDLTYYFQIESVNENGVSERTAMMTNLGEWADWWIVPIV